MVQWYKNNRRRFRDERKALASVQPLMRLTVAGPGFEINRVLLLKSECVVAHGTYTLYVPDSYRQIEYGIVLVTLKNYPNSAPEMFCNDPKLPIGDIDRHIMKDGRACLGVRADINMRWSSRSTIADFLDNFVAPFLVWQVYYEVHKRPPSWGERSHFSQGILEFYAELLDRSVDSSVVGFMRLLARKNRPKGHELCPCNLGKRLRHCHAHRNLIYKTRERVAWEDVGHDFKLYLRGDKIK